MYGDLGGPHPPGADERKAEVAGTEQTPARPGLPDRPHRGARHPRRRRRPQARRHGLGRPRRAHQRRPASTSSPPTSSRSAPPWSPYPLTKALHLKSAVTALPDGTVVGWEEVVDDPRRWDSFLGVPGGAGLARRAARRGDRADVVGGAPDARPVRGARAAGGAPWTSRSTRSSRAASPACRCACAADDPALARSGPADPARALVSASSRGGLWPKARTEEAGHADGRAVAGADAADGGARRRRRRPGLRRPRALVLRRVGRGPVGRSPHPRARRHRRPRPARRRGRGRRSADRRRLGPHAPRRRPGRHGVRRGRVRPAADVRRDRRRGPGRRTGAGPSRSWCPPDRWTTPAARSATSASGC